MGLLSTVGGLAGTYFGGPLGGMAGSAIGGALEGGASTAGGMQQSAAAQQAAQQAARAAQFRPVGITNTFGTSNFGYDEQGNLTSAGYTLDPRLAGAQTNLLGGIGQNLQDQANIQAMGRQYMAQSPQEQAQQYIANQQALLAPSREQQSANLMNQLSNTGRTGLSIAQGGNLGAANPEYQALANARALQDLQLAAQATQAGQQQYQFGQGLLSSAYQPYTAGLQAAGATEALGQSPFTLSTGLAGSGANAGANAGKFMTTPAYGYSPSGTLLSSLGNASAGVFGQNANMGLNPFTGNAYDWTTGSSVIPQSTFGGGGSSLMDPELAALIGL
jgi:YD repeat-containing protein